MPVHHTPAQQEAFDAIQVALDAWLAAEAALEVAETGDDDVAYGIALGNANRLKHELAGAWDNYRKNLP